MAEGARHTDPIRPDQILVVIIGWVLVVAVRIPLARGFLVEVGVREQAQADDAGRLAIIRSDRHVPAAGTCRHARIFALVRKRVGAAVGAPLIEPKSIVLWIGSGW